jgi:hypothetical protein
MGLEPFQQSGILVGNTVHHKGSGFFYLSQRLRDFAALNAIAFQGRIEF